MSDATFVPGAARPLSHYFSRITYVTDNLATTRQSFSRLIGIPAFSSRDVSLNCAGPGASAGVRVRISTAAIGPRHEFEVELVEPIQGDSILSRFLGTSAQGLHHIGFTVPDYGGSIGPLSAQSPPLMEYEADNRRGGFFSCTPLGAIIEVIEESGDRLSASSHGAEPCQGNSLGAYFMQVAYIVRDLDAAHQWLKDTMGIHDFETHAMSQGPALNLKIRGKAVSYDFQLKRSVGHLGPAGQVEIELLKPELRGNPLGEFLETHGPGLHHIAFKVPDYDSATRALHATGTPPLKEISRGRIHSSYFDCAREGLSYVEVFQVD